MNVNKVNVELSVKKSLPNVFSFPVTFGMWARLESGASHEQMKSLWDFVEAVIAYHFAYAVGTEPQPLPRLADGVVPETVYLSVGAKRDLPPDILSYGPQIGLTVALEEGDDLATCVSDLSQMVRTNMRSAFLRAIGKEDYGLNLALSNPHVTIETE